MKKIAIFTLKLALTGVLIYYVAHQVWINWDQIGAFDWQFDPLYLLLSLAFAIAALFIFAAAWGRVVSGFGHQLSVFASFRILNLSNLGRYIPGKIWQVFGMLYLAKQKNIPEEQAAASFVIYQMFTIPASLLVWVFAAQFESALLIDKFKIMGAGSAYTLGGFGLLVCLLLVFFPQPFLKIANFLLKRFGRPVAVFGLDKSVALQAFVGYFIGWIVFGLAFWFFLLSVLGDTAPSMIVAVGLYNVAYQIGYLALFAPGGLGPRELIIGVLLEPFVGPIAPALALVARLWSILIDSSAAIAALGIKK